MVFESLIRAGFARKHPVSMLLNAVILGTIGIFVGLSLFPSPQDASAASALGIAFTAIGIVPVLYVIFVKEEKEEAKKPGAALTFLERHFDIIMVYSWFFIGLVLTYAFWYYMLPEAQRSVVFKLQESSWQQINNLRANATGPSEIATACKSTNVSRLAINCIFFNNATVLGWAILFSLLYGAGAVFLIIWNASIIGLVIGKEMLSASLEQAVLRAIGLLPHGAPEIVSYFIGAIAGGIISVGITKKKYKTKEFETLLKDASVLVVTAYVILFAAAIIEAYLIIGG